MCTRAIVIAALFLPSAATQAISRKGGLAVAVDTVISTKLAGATLAGTHKGKRKNKRQVHADALLAESKQDEKLEADNKIEAESKEDDELEAEGVLAWEKHQGLLREDAQKID